MTKSIQLIMTCLLFSLMAQAQAVTGLYDKLKDINLATVIYPDSIGDDSGEKFQRPEILGFIGDDYQRFQIHFTSFSKNKQLPYQYDVKGKTRVKGNICNFSGILTVVNADYEEDDPIYGNYKRATIISEITLYEDKSQLGSGTIKGNLTTGVYFNTQGQPEYDALMIAADGYENNQFTGSWQSYKTGKAKTCNWGDFRIPDSGNLDDGAGEFSVNQQYINKGWETHYYSYCCDLSKPETIAARKKELAPWWE